MKDGSPTRSLIVYGPHLFPSKLATLLKGLSPVFSATVVVPSAFLSFDVKGIPYLEPCHANCIVQGYNDTGPLDKESDSKEDEAYKRWVWERCSTGAEFEGALPHPLEGMVFTLSNSEFCILLQRLLSASPRAPYSLVPVEYSPFVNGDPEERAKPPDSPSPGAGGLCAELVVFDSSVSARSSELPLQPTQQYLALILRGAFFTGPLSRTYLSHLFLLRPYDPPRASWISKRVLNLVARLVLVPEFLLVWLPRKVFNEVVVLMMRGTSSSYGRGGQSTSIARTTTTRFGTGGLLDALERIVERVTGISGYRN